MKFLVTPIEGAWLIEPEPFKDERGHFARVFCRNTFASKGLETLFLQNSISHNHKLGTLRGLHYQAAPFEEVKLVQVVQGALFDVLVDLRPHSKTYLKWYGTELSSLNGRLLYVPQGVAHGFQTLEDNTTVYYMISQEYAPQYARGVRWNDPAFGIKWPISEPVISQKDKIWPDYKP